LIHRLTGIVNFAFGDLVGLGIFATLLVLAGTTPVSQGGAHEPKFIFALIVGLAVCVLAGAATYVGLVQPYLNRGSTIGWGAGTAAVAFAIRALIGAVFQRSSYVFPDPLPFHRVGTAGFVHLGGAQVQARAFFVAGLAIALALGSAWFLERTRHGRALRAGADDHEGARAGGRGRPGGRPCGRRAGRAADHARIRARRRVRDVGRDRRRSRRGGQRE